MAKSIKAQLDAIAKKSKEKADRVVKETYFEVFNRTILRSPVDTGLFRANWLGGFDIDKSLQPLSSDATGRLRNKLTLIDTSQNQVFYFTNSLPYAQRLEYGWSAKSPNGMVRISAAEFKTIAAQKINEVKAL